MLPASYYKEHMFCFTRVAEGGGVSVSCHSESGGKLTSSAHSGYTGFYKSATEPNLMLSVSRQSSSSG